MVAIKFCECLFIVCHSGRATIFYFHKHVSLLETSISRIFFGMSYAVAFHEVGSSANCSEGLGMRLRNSWNLQGIVRTWSLGASRVTTDCLFNLGTKKSPWKCCK